MSIQARVALAAAALASALPALAIESVKMMIPATADSGWDITGRELGRAMIAAGTVKNVQYDNRAGASGAIGLTQFVSSSKGDPGALLVGGMVMLGSVMQTQSAVTLSHVTPLARLASEYEVIVVAANGPRTLKELLDAFKSSPGSVTWGGGGAGTILMRLVAKEVGVAPAKASYVTFKGNADVVSAIVGGRVSAGILALSEFVRIKSGDVRALAVSSAKASDGIASLREQGVNVQLANWHGVFAAPGITRAQRDELIKAIESATRSREWQESLRKNDREAGWLPGDAFGSFIDAETKRLEGVFAP